MLLAALLARGFSSIRSDVQLKISVNSSWGPASPIDQLFCFINEHAYSAYPCIIGQYNAAASKKFTQNETVRLASACLSGFEMAFFRYLMHFDFYAPRVEFYSSLDRKKEVGHFGFEPGFDKSLFADLSERKILPYNTTIRPLHSAGVYNAYPLKGYGVEFRPFRYSMEYGVKNSAPIANSSIPVEEDYSIVNFTTDSSPPSPKALKRAFYSFLNSIPEQRRLSALRTVAENWPISAKYVSQTEIDQEVEDDASELSSWPESNQVVLNGRVIPISTFDPFTFAESIDQELSIQKVLQQSFSVSKQSRHFLAEQKVVVPELFLDLRSAPIIWINDIEADRRYKKWHTKLKSLPKEFTTIPRIRRNIINSVLIVDPSEPSDLKAIVELQNLLSDGSAIHAGLLLSPNFNSTKSLEDCSIISELWMENQSLLFDFFQRIAKSPNLSLSDIYANLTGSEPTKKADQLSNYTKYLTETGVSRPAIWCNGAYHKGEDMEDQILTIALRGFLEIANPTDNGVEFMDLDSLLALRKALPRYVSSIIESKVPPLQITSLTAEKQISFADSIKKINYWKEDSEAPLVSSWIVVRRGREELEKTLNEYFTNPHKTPTRVALYSSTPEFLSPLVSKAISIGFESSDATIFVNGRVIHVNSSFTEFSYLFDWQSSAHAAQISSMILSGSKILYSDPQPLRVKEDLLLYWSMVLCSFDELGIVRHHFHPNLFDKDSPAVIKSGVDSELSLQCVFDPFSKDFQKMAGFLATFGSFGIADLSIFLNARINLTSIPSSFYRYVDDDFCLLTAYNSSVTYSVLLETPETWMVEQARADVDLDNVLSCELGPGQYVGTFALKNLVIEGKSINQSYQNCEGYQLSIGNVSGVYDETLTMRQFGYWQLKARPGIWEISQSGSVVPVSSFAWSQKTLVLPSKVQPHAEDDGMTHVFVVSSGHLYERLAKIMMLSAVKHSQNSTLKFWFFQSYLSPKFREILPKMASTYRFKYELVSFHWPAWLQRQTEKQRIIWGNKILFLDVLFPLSLKRVIYVDSDQIVRTNLRELMMMDFGDAPYAFTPFCDSRKETEPFRFWKAGYWTKQLAGKKYHISALFSVDLQKFREISAGDWLRYYYSELVLDPNSLANLDQDLPNYAQGRIPIYSLAQNWLWCETWCSDDTMDEAKTIDLCNNPLTKRPKLEIAKTRVKEWPSLDREAAMIEEGMGDEL